MKLGICSPECGLTNPLLWHPSGGERHHSTQEEPTVWLLGSADSPIDNWTTGYHEPLAIKTPWAASQQQAECKGISASLGRAVRTFHVSSQATVATVVQSLIHVQLFATPWIAACQAFLSFTVFWNLLKFTSTESVMPSNHLILCRPLLLLPQIFPSIGVFSNEPALCIRWPKYRSFSFSIVLPMNIQGLFPLGLTSLIFLLSKGFSRVFSSAQLKNISSLVLSLLYGSTLTPVHGYWKEHSFNYIYLCWQSDVSAF